MTKSLMEFLKEIPDFRRAQGKRYQLEAVLAMIIMGLLSGRHGYRELGVFMKANQEELIKLFGISTQQVPSYVTIRTILQQINFEDLSKAFTAWSQQHITVEKGDTFCIDGKALSSTVTNQATSLQDFICLVSVYSQRQRAVLAVRRYHNGETTEILALREVLAMLGITGATFTMDALHAQKKHSR